MKKSRIILIHIGFWIILTFLLLPSIVFLPIVFDSQLKSVNLLSIQSLISISSVLISLLIAFYGSFGFTKIMIRKPKLKVVLFVIIMFLIISSILFSNHQRVMVGFIIRYMGLFLILMVILGSLTQFFFAWYKNNQLRIELESQNKESKIALLRSQINPHFLFNTLHNIDTLIKDDPKKASVSLIKLSDIMRYMLREGLSGTVPIEKELEYIQNYISLEKLRFKNENFLNFTIDGNSKELSIAPMLFIPFVENAFKHSVDSDIDDGITICFTFRKNTITFICENIVDLSEIDKDKSHGIGLSTVKKRLEILFPNKHNLNIIKENTYFKVRLDLSFDED